MKVENNYIVLDRKKHDSDEDFLLDVGKFMDLLTKNYYTVLFRYEDCGIYVMEIATDPRFEPDTGEDRFMRVTVEEEEKICLDRRRQEEEERRKAYEEDKEFADSEGAGECSEEDDFFDEEKLNKDLPSNLHIIPPPKEMFKK